MKSRECILLGYCQDSKGYRLWDINEQKVIKARDISFVELPDSQFTAEPIRTTVSIPILSDLDTQTKEGSEEQVMQDDSDTSEEQQSSDEEQEKEPLASRYNLRRSNRPRKPKNLDDYIVYSAIEEAADPSTFEDALDRADA